MKNIFAFFILLVSSCYTSSEAEDFYNEQSSFENRWWRSEIFDICLLVEPSEENIYFEDYEGTYFVPYRFESPNLYHIDDYDYTAKVYPNHDCYDIVVGIISETVCECSYY